MVVIDFVMAYSSLLREKNVATSSSYAHGDVISRVFTFLSTKYNLSSVLKTLEFSRVRSTSDNFDVSNSRDELLLVFTPKNVNFLFILYLL